jgi:hypothetical protein
VAMEEVVATEAEATVVVATAVAATEEAAMEEAVMATEATVVAATEEAMTNTESTLVTVLLLRVCPVLLNLLLLKNWLRLLQRLLFFRQPIEELMERYK